MFFISYGSTSKNALGGSSITPVTEATLNPQGLLASAPMCMLVCAFACVCMRVTYATILFFFGFWNLCGIFPHVFYMCGRQINYILFIISMAK